MRRYERTLIERALNNADGGARNKVPTGDYGKQARKGVNRYYEILHKIISAREMGKTLIVIGAVKEARLRFFGYLIDWFISRGSGLICPELEGEPIDIEWEEKVVSPHTLTDNKAMANLMATARSFPKTDVYFSSCPSRICRHR